MAGGVLVLTLSFGSGHVRAARSIADAAIERGASPVRVIDALADSRLAFRAAYELPYWAMIRYAPGLWRRLFESRSAKQDASTAPEWALRWGFASTFDAVEGERPDAIVAAEVAACEIACLARRGGRTSARIVCAITDHEAEPIWVRPEVDAYAVASERVADQLASWGAPRGRVAVCGIPVDRAFSSTGDPIATRARYGVRDGRPLVLLMGGGRGPTRMDDVARRLCESGVPMHVVAVAGRDRAALARLRRVRADGAATFDALGWTDDVPALMRAASILATKPGGLTTAEAAVCGVPVVAFDAIPGPEEHNAERLVRLDAGVSTRGGAETARAVLDLLGDEPRRRRLAANAASAAMPGAAQAIAKLALGGAAGVAREPRRAFA
jgi:processive 1,2-diacylglycerol beta-glucosyltransferase